MGEFDSNPMGKAMERYEKARAYGASDGTAAGNLGADDARRERNRQKSRGVTANKPKPKKLDERSKVICTELNRRGLLSRDDYLLGVRFVQEHLTARHERGYHFWALPVVRTMRRSPWSTAFWHVLAKARADHIAFVYGDGSRANRFGALLCAIGHPVCYLIGGLVREQGWRALYLNRS